MSDWSPYVVSQGDTLTSLACRSGASPEDVWTNDNNASLSGKRKNGDILFPSDVIYLPNPPTPATPVATGSTTTFVSTVPTMKIRVQVEDYAGSSYVAVVGDGAPISGSVTEAGQLELEVPVTATEIAVTFGADPPLSLKVGCLDPIAETSGLEHRLSNIGLPTEPDEDDHSVRRALALFQDAKSLEPSGDLDSDTQTALEDEHGL